MALILGVNIPRSMTKRSISLPSPNLMSLMKYDVPDFRRTWGRCYNGGHKIWIAHPKLSFLLIGFSSRDSRRVPPWLQRGSSFFTPFSPHLSSKMSTICFSKEPYTPAYIKNKLYPFATLGCALRELHTNFQHFITKFANLR